MSKKVDITGLMVKSKKGWEKRTKELAKPEHFFMLLSVEPFLKERLTRKEYNRLIKKLKLVCQAAAYMAAGMVKGTIKYPKDDLPVEQWISSVVGEGADLFNYQILLADAFDRSKK